MRQILSVTVVVLLLLVSGCAQQTPTAGMEIADEKQNISSTETPETPPSHPDSPAKKEHSENNSSKVTSSVKSPPPLPDYLTEQNEVPERNPVLTKEVIVYIDTPEEYKRNLRPHVQAAFRWWDENETAYFGVGNYSYAITDNASNATVILHVVSKAEDHCPSYGYENLHGCAPILDDSPEVRAASVYIETGYDDEYTAKLIGHELGHVLGKTHYSKAPIMVPDSSYKIPVQGLRDNETKSNSS